eukprot:14503358-Ditylum_brightwellii.AAC.1
MRAAAREDFKQHKMHAEAREDLKQHKMRVEARGKENKWCKIHTAAQNYQKKHEEHVLARQGLCKSEPQGLCEPEQHQEMCKPEPHKLCEPDQHQEMCKPEPHELCKPEQHQKVCARRTRVSEGDKNEMHVALKNQIFQGK